MFVKIDEWKRRLSTWRITVVDARGRELFACAMYMMPSDGAGLYVPVQARGLVFCLSERGQSAVFLLKLTQDALIDHFAVDVRADPPTLGIGRGESRMIIPFEAAEVVGAD